MRRRRCETARLLLLLLHLTGDVADRRCPTSSTYGHRRRHLAARTSRSLALCLSLSLSLSLATRPLSQSLQPSNKHGHLHARETTVNITPTPHSFISRLKPPVSANFFPPQHSFSSSGMTTCIPRTACCYF